MSTREKETMERGNEVRVRDGRRREGFAISDRVHLLDEGTSEQTLKTVRD